ncbi:MAG: YchF/TatD family DNA exonuclease [Deltaproteobacteria bacterium]|nr:YchF/TatD family DNA exonuclease [Deltaproteobacteria bacterium]
MENKNQFIDSHAHLDEDKFDADLPDVIARAKAAGLKHVISVGCWKAKDNLDKLMKIADGDFIKAAAGVHPHDAKDAVDETPFERLKSLAKEKKIVAIGETGLDFHYTHSPKDKQREVFTRQIRLAKELNLPLIVHSREADDETMAILKNEGAKNVVIHCFSGTEKMAREAVDAGYYLSFTGVVTFPKAEELRAVVKAVPIEKMFIETDCPYLAPVPYRGKRCEPAHVVETAKKIAEIKRLSVGDVARITARNIESFFGLAPKEAKKAEIAYVIRNSLYLNITNRCSNKCTFCAKNDGDYVVKGHYLELEKEPSMFEILDAINALGKEVKEYDEVVFCGYGEPLIRFDLVKELGTTLKRKGAKIRINTDGLANLYNKKNILSELMFVDVISVSLNAPDAATYEKLCQTPFGEKAHPAILFFLKEAKRFIAKVVATVVAVPGLDIEACRKIAEDDIGVVFRVRPYNEVG